MTLSNNFVYRRRLRMLILRRSEMPLTSIALVLQCISSNLTDYAAFITLMYARHVRQNYLPTDVNKDALEHDYCH